MRFKISFPFVFLGILLSPTSFAQLSGYFTAGSSNADYPSISLALEDMQTQGINGPITIGVFPGNYYGFNIPNIPGASEENRITIEALSLDSTDVIIQSEIKIFEAHYFTFNAITLETDNTKVLSCTRAKGIQLKNCIVNSNYDGQTSEGAINIRHFNEGSVISEITIENCAIKSFKTAIYISLNQGRALIKNCTIISEDGDAIDGDWLQNITLENNNINGDIDISTTANSFVKWNTIYGEIEIGNLNSLIGNHIVSDDPIRINSNLFEDNYIEGPILYCIRENPHLYNNYLNIKVHLSHTPSSVIKGNHILKAFNLSFNKALVLENNYIYGDFLYGDPGTNNYNYHIHNNIFSNCNLDARGANSTISYNTFIDSAYLYSPMPGLKVHDNLFCLPVTGAAMELSNNNYYPLTPTPNDTLSFNYDPQFHDNQAGIASNPLLQGKSISEAPEFDILGHKRQSPAAIGANEIFICTDSSNNQLSIPCGENVYLNICGLPETGESWWTPDDCITNPDSSYAMVTACENNMTLYLYNTEFGLIDSVMIQMEEFNVEIPEMPTFYCQHERILNASYHPKASYHWSPEIGLSNPNIRNPILSIEDTLHLQYILTCEIEGCNTSYDTLNIEYNLIPRGTIYSPTQIADTVFFSCAPICADEFLWDFGDGTTSSQQNPYHIYNENGIYTITLTLFNDFGENSGSFEYNYYWINSHDIQRKQHEITITPNPANDFILIKGLSLHHPTIMSILNMSGEMVYNNQRLYEEATINTQNFKNGIYIIQLLSESININKKIMIIH